MSHTVARVLIVDDNQELAENMCEILAYQNISGEFAEDGDAALARLEQNGFDLVITDIRMPGMNGVQLLRHIHERWPQKPVIVMSAYASDANLDDAVLAGALEIWFKPIDVDHMFALILNVVDLG